jgi:hypothetical protein
MLTYDTTLDIRNFKKRKKKKKGKKNWLKVATFLKARVYFWPFCQKKGSKKVPNCFAQRTSTCLKRAYNLIVDPVPDPAGGHLYGVVPIPVKRIFWTSRTGHQNKAGVLGSGLPKQVATVM